MTMRDITELMELVTAMLFAFRRWNGRRQIRDTGAVAREVADDEETNMGLLAGAVCPCGHSRCCSRAPLDGLVVHGTS